MQKRITILIINEHYVHNISLDYSMLILNVIKRKKMNIFRENEDKLAYYYANISLNMKHPFMESGSDLANVYLAKISDFHYLWKSL